MYYYNILLYHRLFLVVIITNYRLNQLWDKINYVLVLVISTAYYNHNIILIALC